MADPLDPIDQLARRAGEETAKVGLPLLSLEVSARLDPGEPRRVTLVLGIDPEALGKSPQQRADQLAIDGMIEATARADREREVEESRKELVDLAETLRDPNKGILG